MHGHMNVKQNTYLLHLVDNISKARSALFRDISPDNSLPMFWDNLSFPFSRVKKSNTLEDGPLFCPETSVRNNHCRPRNIPEERRYQLLRSGGLKSHIFFYNTLFSNVQKYVKNLDQQLLIYGPIFMWTSRMLTQFVISYSTIRVHTHSSCHYYKFRSQDCHR